MSINSPTLSAAPSAAPLASTLPGIAVPSLGTILWYTLAAAGIYIAARYAYRRVLGNN